MKKGFAHLIVLFVILLIGIVVLFYLVVPKRQTKIDDGGINVPPTEVGGVFCTMDAKVCPDGSSVGRVPPTCGFEQCPGESIN